ncbi:LLM class F420-dependent oxidoreductase [Myxococcota bacterium]|nr:LLM class F420-dependent oxidoreductase [Myxococcota bacterium]
MSWGIELPDDAIDFESLTELGRDLEAAGYASVWSGETSGCDAVAVLSILGAATSRIHLGTAVLPVYTRTPGMLALSTGTLAMSFPGRVSIGIGASSAFIVERWNGVPFQRPYARVRDTLRFLRTALAGKKVSQEFETFTIRGFRMRIPPQLTPPLLIGATGPRMFECAIQEADGIILNWCSAQDIATLPTGAAQVYALLNVYPNEDRDAVHALARPYLAQYLSVPAYAGQQRRLGRGEPLSEVWDAWDQGDYAAAGRAVPEDVIDELIIHGSPAECREKIAEFARVSGATPLVIPKGDPERLREVACSIGPDGA